MKEYEINLEETGRKVVSGRLARNCLIGLLVAVSIRGCLSKDSPNIASQQDNRTVEMQSSILYDGNGLPQSYELRPNELDR